MASNYEQLVEALRYCVKARNCEKCAYRINNNSVKCRVQRVEDAAAAIDALDRLLDQNTQRCEGLRKQLREAQEQYEKHLNELEQQLPKRGEWVKRHEFVEDMRFDGFRCSICNWWKGDFETYNYCPKCGAKMEVQDGQD